MSKKWMFVDRGGKTTEVKVDQSRVDRQAAELRRQGHNVTIFDEEDRIRFGLLQQQISKQHKSK